MPSAPFHGLSAFVPTPADADGRVRTGALASLLDSLSQTGVDSIGLLGSTGIYAYLDRAERNRAVAVGVEAVVGRKPLIVGVSTVRTDWSRDLAREAERAGADALLLAPVSYTPLTGHEAFTHYRTIAASTGLPLCIYNNPSTTHFTFTHSLIARLSQEPRITGVKMTLPAHDDIAAERTILQPLCRDGFAIGYSGDWAIASAMQAGAAAFYSALAGVLPGPVLRLTRASQNGEIREAAALNQALEPLWALVRTHGSLRIVYAIAGLRGIPTGPLPLPLLPVSEDVVLRLSQFLDTLAD
ncbi:dihydrodipicolinate synthase family protein [Acetobacter fallax]|uniref:Dihydrodipicolinate synthase family protein n=1 Tax=Acetobacter fallax TaxID=1737473 RepID=A0ABX0K949_9PROT|nr:dihydrodipicolinate synthase family protein [Acetobacter fallax]NHO32746.1 dihydrodipicolinate synthase family protein [Acetobacter fallax]NHO36309.1 dihydrodipicolinate synthase family protein [Acetobacter fallax]